MAVVLLVLQQAYGARPWASPVRIVLPATTGEVCVDVGSGIHRCAPLPEVTRWIQDSGVPGAAR